MLNFVVANKYCVVLISDDVKDACHQCDITCGTDVEDYIREAQYHVLVEA